MKQKGSKGMRRRSEVQALSAVDVFAGGGGLTVGLKRAGFNVVAAVEIESNAFATYKVNHPEVNAFKQDVRTITGRSLSKLSPTGKVDLLAGCPPCQGFCSLTSKYRRPDPRNGLIKEMGRLVEEMKPVAVMMENVPGLARKGRKLLDELLSRFSSLGYIPTWSVLQVADYGVPQSRRRLVVLAGRGFPIEIPQPTHSRTPNANLEPWVTIDHVIKGLPEPITLEEAQANGGPGTVSWHVVRTLSSQNQRRLKAARPGKHWRSIPKRLRPKCHQDGETGFSNVYGRMIWKQVSPTITGGVTTLSKGRFGHPTKNRTISVREAALLQTFPNDYVFDTPYMEHVCNIVGNALPCDFAEILAQQCANAIIAHRNAKR